MAPEQRGQGLGTLLFEYFFRAALDKGCTMAVLDVSRTNPRAQALYERLGFRVKGELVSNLRNQYAVIPSYWRMEKPLV